MGKIWRHLILLSLLIAFSASCNSLKSDPKPLYETIATSRQTYIYEKSAIRSPRIETLKEGERLAVLVEPKNRWLQVRTPSGTIGWVETRDVMRREHFEEWENLSKKIQHSAPQMKGETAEVANLRLRPGRDSIKVNNLVGVKSVEIFGMAHTEKPGQNAEPSEEDKADSNIKAAEQAKELKSKGKKSSKRDKTSYDTWYLIRTSEGMVGWLYSGLVLLSVPEELARLSENKTIIAWRSLSVSKDSQGQEHPLYLSIEREVGSNKDFDRVRVLYWNPGRKRYELAYRIQNIIGVLPIEAKSVNPAQPGNPSFKIRHLSEENPDQIKVDEYQVVGTKTTLVSSTIEGA